MILLRLGRKYSTWESKDADELVRLAFPRNGGLDLRPSVYELEPGNGPLAQAVLRTHAEHAASHLQSPQGAIDVDVTDLFEASVERSRGETLFEFTCDAHRELVFADESALRQFVVTIMKHLNERKYEVKRTDLVDFAAQRLAARDREWLHAREVGPLKNWTIKGH